ncbi:spore germination protein [Virgibacillus sp. FSP13]
MNDRFMVGPIKIDSQAGNSSVNFGDTSFSGNTVYNKSQGNAIGIGDPSSVFAPTKNGWLDNDANDQDSGGSPTISNPYQP